MSGVGGVRIPLRTGMASIKGWPDAPEGWPSWPVSWPTSSDFPPGDAEHCPSSGYLFIVLISLTGMPPSLPIPHAPRPLPMLEAASRFVELENG